MLCATAAVESCWCIPVHLDPLSDNYIATAATTANGKGTAAVLVDFADCWYILVAYQLVVHTRAS